MRPISLQTELNVGEAPQIFHRFASIIGEPHWKRRVIQLQRAIKGNPLIGDFLRQENLIVFALEKWSSMMSRVGHMPSDLESARDVYPAIAFAAQVLSVIDSSTPVEASRLCQKVRGAFTDASMMRGYLLELLTATHFVRRGHTVQWPEMLGFGTFDLLVLDLAENGVEIECKSISDDKGRCVHRMAAIQFSSLVLRECTTICKTLRVGLCVVVTLPGRLPTLVAERSSLAKRIKRQIDLACGDTLDDGTTLRIFEFDLARVDRITKKTSIDIFRSEIDALTGTQNAYAMFTRTDAGGAVVFVVKGATDDTVLNTTFSTLSIAAKRQLTGNRPGILIAGFEGMSATQMLSLGGQDHNPEQSPTGLAISVSKFLSAQHRDHVVGVGFLSRSALREPSEGVIDSGGAAYFFPKRESPYWHDDLSGLFAVGQGPLATAG